MTDAESEALATQDERGRGELRAVLDTNVPIAAVPDDNAILACAFVSRATHIVTYDPHFDVLGGAYQGIPILDGLHFLYLVRGDRPSDTVA